MRDYVLVNIYNEGMIPWIKKQGPLREVSIGLGVYTIMLKDPRINMELSYVAKERERVELERKNQLAREATIKEVEKLKKVIEKEAIEEIEKQAPVILSEKIELEDSINFNENESIEEKIKEELSKSEEEETDVFEIKLKENETIIEKFSEKDLDEMTKDAMKSILKKRGYKEGPFAGKYHDTAEILKEKIRKTQ